jgi:hypothetical protein
MTSWVHSYVDTAAIGLFYADQGIVNLAIIRTVSRCARVELAALRRAAPRPSGATRRSSDGWHSDPPARKRAELSQRPNHHHNPVRPLESAVAAPLCRCFPDLRFHNLTLQAASLDEHAVWSATARSLPFRRAGSPAGRASCLGYPLKAPSPHWMNRLSSGLHAGFILAW